MEKKVKRRKKDVKIDLTFIIAIISVFLAFFAGYMLSGVKGEVKIIKNVIQRDKIYLSDSPDLYVKSIEIPAVSSENEGILGKITVIIRKGTGKVLIDVGDILVNEDSQHSFRTAAEVAYNLSGINMKDYDTIYKIDINSPAIEGSSAGASVTILTYAALNDLKLNNSVIMTGTIHQDGTIGPANGILEKAEAAKKAGKKLFLVPQYQSEEVKMKEKEICRDYNGKEFCSKEVYQEKVNISYEVGIKVVEVKDINDALNYFIERK